MILVKSLIWILLILIGFYAYDHIGSLASLFDGRQGFQSREGFQAVAEEDNTDDDDINAIDYSKKVSVENEHKNIANDAEMINAVQEKMNELLNLNDQAIDINNSLKQ